MAGLKLNKIQILSVVIGILVLLTPLLIGHFRAKQFERIITSNSEIVSGRIVGFEKTYKRADALIYEYIFNNNYYIKNGNSNGKANDYKLLSKHVMKKTFPVLINRDNPKEYSKLLIVPEDFQVYDLTFPDSLKWVLEFIER